MIIFVYLKTVIKTYRNLRKPLLFLLVAALVISTFSGEVHKCICKNPVEIKAEKKSCCSSETDCRLPEKEAENSCHDKHNCDVCNICSVSNQDIDQPYIFSSNNTVKAEKSQDNNWNSCTTSDNIKVTAFISGHSPDIHTKIFISVSNLRI